MKNNCNKCNEPIKLGHTHKCDVGCKDITTTDCIIHRTTETTCLNFPKETTLDKVIKAFDTAFCNIVLSDEKVKVSADDLSSGYLEAKIKLVGGDIVKKNTGGVEYLELSFNPYDKKLVDWDKCEYCNNTMKYCPDGYVYNELTDKCRNLECDCDSETVLPEDVIFEADTIEEAINKLLDIICCLKTEIDNIEPPIIDLSGVNWELCNPCRKEDDPEFVIPVTVPEAFDEVLNRICCIADLIITPSDALKVFYVDGNNINTGDGSVLNPFKTIDSAINAVIGTGTRIAPQNTNVKIEVASFVYTPNINLYVNTLNINFSSGTIINHTSAINLIESLDTSSTYQRMTVTGNLEYRRMNPNSRFINLENPKALSIDLDYIEDYIGNASLGNSIIRISSTGVAESLVGALNLNFNKIIRSYSDTIFDIRGEVSFRVYGKTNQSLIVLGARGDTGAINGNPISGKILSYININTNPPPNVDVVLENTGIGTVNTVTNPFYIQGYLRVNGISQFRNLVLSAYGTSPHFPLYFDLDLAADQDNFIMENIKILNNFSTVNPGLVINSASMRKITLLNNNFPSGFSINFNNLNIETAVNLTRKVSINIIDGKLMITGIEDFTTAPTIAQGYRKNMIWMTKDGTLKAVL